LGSGQNDASAHVLLAGGGWNRWNPQCCNVIVYILYPREEAEERCFKQIACTLW
jgi:hypothetical protein